MPLGCSVSNMNAARPLNLRFFKKAVILALKECGGLKSADIELAVLSDSQIKGLNRKFKGRNRATDVLSFDLRPSGARPGHLAAAIAISSDRAFVNAGIYDVSYARELVLYAVHGILHLTGFDDQSSAQRAGMRCEEARILERLCGKMDLSRVLTPR